MKAETAIRVDKCGSSGVGNSFPYCSGLIHQTMEQGRRNSSEVGTLVPCYYGSGPDPCCLEGYGYWFLSIAACQNKIFFFQTAARRVLKKSFLYIALFKKERSIWMIMN
ncbi:MAG: hypothetical protein ABIL02_07020 [candidate division WOR-3 bacterium]